MSAMENSSEKEYTLEDFRLEIAEIAKKESEDGETADFSGRFSESDLLTENDMEIWLKIKNGSVTESDFNSYREIYENEKGYDIPIRHGFLSLAGNKANGIIGKRWLKKEQTKN